jgi:predicted RNA binding protein YcfA (HicA-like mRNA interferase family)
MANTKDIKQLIKKAEKQGWIVSLSKGGHLRWKSPDGKMLFCSATPGDVRMIKNHEAEMRRNGYIRNIS